MKVSNKNAKGFSLIEVLIAVAVFSFAAVALIGLLSVSLASGQASSSDNAVATMTQTVMSSLKSIDFTQVTSTTGTAIFFDARGTRLVDSQGNDLTLAAARTAGAVYQCTVTASATPPINTATTNSSTVLMAIALDFSWPIAASVPSKHKTVRTCLADYD